MYNQTKKGIHRRKRKTKDREKKKRRRKKRQNHPKEDPKRTDSLLRQTEKGA
jgi:hypothetical protein